MLSFEKTDLIRSLLARVGDETPFQATPVSGGCINDTYRIVSVRGDYFLKVNQRMAIVQAEQQALVYFARLTNRLYPAPLALERRHGISGLLMEYCQLQPLRHQTATALGVMLAEQHRITHTQHGWASDNYVGSTVQTNDWHDHWLTFWRDCRLGKQITLAKQAGASTQLIDLGHRVMEQLPRWLSGHQPLASLLHGDLWIGNADFDVNTGQGRLYDPAVYFGDRETDLAMTELFGGFPPTFYQGYNDTWPLEPGYQQRKPLYQLYHVLNHFCLFAGHYHDQSIQLMQQLLHD